MSTPIVPTTNLGSRNTINPIYHGKTKATERLITLPAVTQLESRRATIETQAVARPYALHPNYCACLLRRWQPGLGIHSCTLPITKYLSVILLGSQELAGGKCCLAKIMSCHERSHHSIVQSRQGLLWLARAGSSHTHPHTLPLIKRVKQRIKIYTWVLPFSDLADPLLFPDAPSADTLHATSPKNWNKLAVETGCA